MTGPVRAVALRTALDARIRTASFALLFAGVAVANATGYTDAYPTLRDRLRLAVSFGDNKALRLFYGTPHDLTTVGGYVSWRVGGVLALFAGVLGLQAAVRALRAEEESGREELVVAGVASRRDLLAARVAALTAGHAVVWLALLGGLAAGGLGGAGLVSLASAIVSVALVYTGVGAVASRLMPTRRGALELAGGVLAADFLVRVVADTAGIPWLHWLGPLGWAEEVRAYAGDRGAVLLLPAAAAVALLAATSTLELRRDVGGAVFAPRDTARLRLGLLGSPVRLAVRLEWAAIAVWVGAVATFALVVGSLSKGVAAAISPSLRAQLQRLGKLAIATPTGYIGLTFLFFAFAASLFACNRLGSVHAEEAEGRLEPLLALPVGRVRWLWRRLGLAAAGTVVVSLGAGLGAAVGAGLVGADVSVTRLLEAGLNCLPTGALFLGLAALLLAALPRTGVGIAYGVVSVGFLWELFGALLQVPGWVLGLTPFHHIGLLPAQPFRPVAALVLTATGLVCALAATAIFGRRDLASG